MYADEFSIYAGNANRPLAERICRYIGTDIGAVDVFQFANENIFVRVMENVREQDVFLVQPTSRPVNQSIMELLIMIDAFKRASAGRITAVIPYYSYGRSDKKDQPRVPITARLIADMLTVAGADRVLTMDLHQGQIQGFFSIPVDELTAVNLICAHIKAKQLDDIVVVSELGFAKKARNFAELLAARGVDLVVLLRGSESQGEEHVALVDPRVPQRVQGDGTEGYVARRRLTDRRHLERPAADGPVRRDGLPPHVDLRAVPGRAPAGPTRGGAIVAIPGGWRGRPDGRGPLYTVQHRSGIKIAERVPAGAGQVGITADR